MVSVAACPQKSSLKFVSDLEDIETVLLGFKVLLTQVFASSLLRCNDFSLHWFYPVCHCVTYELLYIIAKLSPNKNKIK